MYHLALQKEKQYYDKNEVEKCNVQNTLDVETEYNF
jgi:hypothetical protein